MWKRSFQLCHWILGPGKPYLSIQELVFYRKFYFNVMKWGKQNCLFLYILCMTLVTTRGTIIIFKSLRNRSPGIPASHQNKGENSKIYFKKLIPINLFIILIFIGSRVQRCDKKCYILTNRASLPHLMMVQSLGFQTRLQIQ